MDETVDVNALVSGLLSDNDSARKFAVFKLQSHLGDPSFAHAFVRGGDGLLALRRAVIEATGNTQAYALGSLNRLLELDLGWDVVDIWVIEKAVSLVVKEPLVNILRNALTLLVLVVSRPTPPASDQSQGQTAAGFTALKPALDKHPTFLEALVVRLSASDHGLCATALQLVNALLRDGIVNGGEDEWPKFVRRLQDLGVIQGVGNLMRGDAASDAGSPLAAAILEFQGLTKTLLRKWRGVRVNLELHEHKKALKTIHLLSKPEPYNPPGSPDLDSAGAKGTRKHHPEKWRRLGFETESPAWEFEDTGYLGMMDLLDYAKRSDTSYQRMFMEQAVQEPSQRCPIVRASLSVTLVLYEHFDIADGASNGEGDGMWDRRELLQQRVLDARASGSLDRLYRPLLLQWGRLHTAALNAFVRLWKASGAETDDFYKVEELVRIIVERIVGGAPRKSEVSKVEEELRSVSLETARRWQTEALDEIYDDAWGPHLVQVREQLHHESLQFIKEQRIRCLLQGSWFSISDNDTGGWRYVRLSPARRWLHYQDYSSKGTHEPNVDSLSDKIDLNNVTSVDSSVSQAQPTIPNATTNSSATTLKDTDNSRNANNALSLSTTTRIAIIGTTSKHDLEEKTLLELHASDTSLASEWLDGLLMLLNQAPITKETTRVVELLEDWGTRLRLLNLRWDDVDWDGLELAAKGRAADRRPVPTREGLDAEYWYRLPDT